MSAVVAKPLLHPLTQSDGGVRVGVFFDGAGFPVLGLLEVANVIVVELFQGFAFAIA